MRNQSDTRKRKVPLGESSFVLTEAQRNELRDLLSLSGQTSQRFFEDIEQAINCYRLDASLAWKQTDVQKFLLRAVKLSEDLINVVSVIANPETASDSLYMAGELVEIYYPNHSDCSVQAEMYVLLESLRRVQVAAQSALRCPMVKSRKPNSKPWAYNFVRELSAAYTEETGKQPGPGRDTPFFRLVRNCFYYANPRDSVKDPIPYIRRLVQDRKSP